MIRRMVLYFLNLYFRLRGIKISPSARVSLKAKLDFTNPSGVIIGDESYVAFGAVILSHDFVRSLHTDTIIGKKCFIGANSIIMPGVQIGDGSIVAAGTIVVKSVPEGVVVAGNPAKIIRAGIKVGRFGQLIKGHS